VELLEQMSDRMYVKQNLMQVLCSLTPANSIIADSRENGVKKTAKTRKHVHL